MKLPQGNRAIIDPRKLFEYSLNREHEDGQHKAALFEQLVGIGPETADRLIAALKVAASDGEAVIGRKDRYGQRYTIDFSFSGPRGSATIRSAWIIDAMDIVPRMITCYIL